MSIVELRVSTIHDIDIYSRKYIYNYNLYYKILSECDFEINIENVFTTNIKKILQDLKVVKYPSETNNYYVEVDSSLKYKLFDIINEHYFQKYNHNINEHELYIKYEDLKNKINITEKHVNNIAKLFDDVSIYKLKEFNILSFWDLIYNLLNYEDCRKSENTIKKKLDELISIYNSLALDQKERENEIKIQNEEKEREDQRKLQEIEKRKSESLKKVQDEIERKRQYEEKMKMDKEIKEKEELLEREYKEKLLLKQREELLNKKREEAVKLSILRKQEKLEREHREREEKRLLEISKSTPVVIVKETIIPKDIGDPLEKSKLEAKKIAEEKSREILAKIEREKLLKRTRTIIQTVEEANINAYASKEDLDVLQKMNIEHQKRQLVNTKKID